MPSKRMPATDALAVSSIIVSRSMNGSLPGAPLPTTPGQVALWSLGNLFGMVFTPIADAVCGLARAKVTYLSSAILLVIPHQRRLRIRARAEVAQHHQRFVASVVEDDAIAGPIVSDERFVFGQLGESDHGRRMQAMLVDPPAAFHGDESLRA